jgi:hypothetical protein
VRRLAALEPGLEKHLPVALKSMAMLLFHQDQAAAEALDAEAEEIRRRRPDARG